MHNAWFEFATPIPPNFHLQLQIIGCRSQTECLSPQSLARGGYKQTPRLPVPDQTLIPDPYRQQGWQSQTKRLSPHHYPAVAPSRRQGWKCPRLNAYPTDPSRHKGWEWPRPNAYPTNPSSRQGWRYPRPKINPLFVPNGLVAITPILPKLKLVIFTVSLHGKMYYTLKLKILHYNWTHFKC